MTFHIQFNKMGGIEGPGKGMPYTAQVKENGKLVQEIKFFDKNGDGKFSDDEISSVIDYGDSFAREYVDNDGDGKFDEVVQYNLKDGKISGQGVKIQEGGQVLFGDERELTEMSKEPEGANRPVVVDANTREYRLQLNELDAARFIDGNKDGVLADNEVTTVLDKTKYENGTEKIEQYSKTPSGKAKKELYAKVGDNFVKSGEEVTGKTLPQVLDDVRKKEPNAE